MIVTLIVKAKTIDYGAVINEAKYPRLRVTGLWSWRNRPNLAETKTNLLQGREYPCILIETRSNTNGVWKVQAHDMDDKLVRFSAPL